MEAGQRTGLLLNAEGRMQTAEPGRDLGLRTKQFARRIIRSYLALPKNGDCLKEADESLYWLELLSEESVLKPSRLSALIQEADELTSIFVPISKRSKGE